MMNVVPVGVAATGQGRSRGPGDRVPTGVRFIGVVAAALYVTYLIWSLLVEPGYRPARDLVLYEGLILLAVVLLVWRSVLVARERWAWAVLAAGLILWVIADVSFTQLTSGLADESVPIGIDLLYLAVYPCAYAAVILLFSSRLRGTGAYAWLDAAILVLGVASVMFLAIPSLSAGMDAKGLRAALMFANPVGALILFSMILGGVGALGWRAGVRWWILVLASATLWVGELIWLVIGSWDTYFVGSYMDMTWPAAFLLMGYAAWSPDRPLVKPERSAVPLLPSFMAVVALGLLVVATQVKVPAVSVALCAGVLVAGVFRSALNFRSVSVLSASERQASIDPLTGLANRRGMSEWIDAMYPGEKYALVLVDIVAFREINDTLGRSAGDTVLRVVAARCQRCVRGDDRCARLSGDEFAILLHAGTGLGGTEAIVERLRDAMLVPLVVAGVDLRVDVSIGSAIAPDHGTTLDELLYAADRAMHRAKQDTTLTATYDPDWQFTDRGNLLLMQEFRVAMESGEVGCYFQPQLDLASNEVVRVEALTRWTHPERGVIRPDNYIPVVENTNLVYPFASVMLDLSVKQASRWRAAGRDWGVSVNLSARNLLDRALPVLVEECLSRYGLPAANLTLEVTETVLMADSDVRRAVMQELHELGVAIAIDDYGMGSSSLDQVRRLGATELKLDRSFVTGVGSRADLQSIVRASVYLSRGLGVRMVAEGVETADDLAFLRAVGCDLAQGYYICLPLPPEELDAWQWDPHRMPTP